MKNEHGTELFKVGEFIAARYLEHKGYTIRECNYRTLYGEIDIIATCGDLIVFAEVKTRTHKSITNTLSNISRTKKIKLTKSATCYINRLPADANFETRFDVIILFHHVDTDTYEVHHFENAFEPVIDRD